MGLVATCTEDELTVVVPRLWDLVGMRLGEVARRVQPDRQVSVFLGRRGDIFTEFVGVVVDPADYTVVLAELRGDGALSPETRRRLARKAYSTTSDYDAQIVQLLDSKDESKDESGEAPTELSATIEQKMRPISE